MFLRPAYGMVDRSPALVWTIFVGYLVQYSPYYQCGQQSVGSITSCFKSRCKLKTRISRAVRLFDLAAIMA